MSFVNDGNGSLVMPVGPMNGNGGFGAGFGDGSFWIIVLFLFALMGNGWGGAFGGAGGAAPVINNDLQRGFDQQALTGGISGINSAIAALAQGQCQGFAGVNAAIANGFAQNEISNNARQMADMQQMFGMQSALQNCCCENRAGLADLKYTIATENCADRTAISDALRDVIASNTANTQAILDKLCQQEIDALKTQNANLQTQLNMASLRESQLAQNATIIGALNPTPVPAYPAGGCGRSGNRYGA